MGKYVDVRRKQAHNKNNTAKNIKERSEKTQLEHTHRRVEKSSKAHRGEGKVPWKVQTDEDEQRKEKWNNKNLLQFPWRARPLEPALGQMMCISRSIWANARRQSVEKERSNEDKKQYGARPKKVFEKPSRRDPSRNL